MVLLICVNAHAGVDFSMSIKDEDIITVMNGLPKFKTIEHAKEYGEDHKNNKLVYLALKRKMELLGDYVNRMAPVSDEKVVRMSDRVMVAEVGEQISFIAVALNQMRVGSTFYTGSEPVYDNLGQ